MGKFAIDGHHQFYHFSVNFKTAKILGCTLDVLQSYKIHAVPPSCVRFKSPVCITPVWHRQLEIENCIFHTHSVFNVNTWDLNNKLPTEANIIFALCVDRKRSTNYN